MLRLRLSKDADGFIASREPKHQRQIVARIQSLRADPAPADCKALKGKGKGLLRTDVGEYRIIYRLEDDVLHVALIGKRNDDDVYRRLERQP